MEKQFLVHKDDEDGALIFENAKTIDHYKELKNLQANNDYPGIFFAFDQKQFDEGFRQVEHLRETSPETGKPEKIISFGAGGYGWEHSFYDMLNIMDGIAYKIKTECDPYEVYCYEYNNHEGCINWDGDKDAMKIIIRIYGKDVARKIKRFRPFYTIDELTTEH